MSHRIPGDPTWLVTNTASWAQQRETANQATVVATNPSEAIEKAVKAGLAVRDGDTLKVAVQLEPQEVEYRIGLAVNSLSMVR